MFQLAHTNLKTLCKVSKMEHYVGSDMSNKIFLKLFFFVTQIELLELSVYLLIPTIPIIPTIPTVSTTWASSKLYPGSIAFVDKTQAANKGWGDC